MRTEPGTNHNRLPRSGSRLWFVPGSVRNPDHFSGAPQLADEPPQTVATVVSSVLVSISPASPPAAAPRVGRLSPAPGIVVREHPERAVTASFLRDLGLPLATVTTLLELIDPDTLPEAARTAIDAAVENAAYARELLRDFANYQALEAGQSRVNPQRVGMRRWLDEVIGRARNRPAARELGLVVTHASLLPDATQFDAGLASAAVDAVLRVACERAERGPVHVRIAYLPAASTTAAARMCLRVTTRGGGFGEIDSSYAFVPFVAQDHRQRPQLGLTLARRWCELLQGSLTVDSPGIEACSYELEFAAPPAEGASWFDPLSEDDSDFGAVHGGRLAFAQELADSRLLAEPLLRRAGFTLSTVGDLDACLRLLHGAPGEVSGFVLPATLGELSAGQVSAALRSEGFRGKVIVLDADRHEFASDHTVLPRVADGGQLLHALRQRHKR